MGGLLRAGRTLLRAVCTLGLLRAGHSCFVQHLSFYYKLNGQINGIIANYKLNGQLNGIIDDYKLNFQLNGH